MTESQKNVDQPDQQTAVKSNKKKVTLPKVKQDLRQLKVEPEFLEEDIKPLNLGVEGEEDEFDEDGDNAEEGHEEEEEEECEPQKVEDVAEDGECLDDEDNEAGDIADEDGTDEEEDSEVVISQEDKKEDEEEDAELDVDDYSDEEGGSASTPQSEQSKEDADIKQNARHIKRTSSKQKKNKRPSTVPKQEIQMSVYVENTRTSSPGFIQHCKDKAKTATMKYKKLISKVKGPNLGGVFQVIGDTWTGALNKPSNTPSGE